jgi:hypothetical protein
MSLTRIPGKQRLVRAILTILVAACPAMAAAQALPKTQAPAPRIIVLPQKAIVGTPATLAVLDAAGRTVPNVIVELSNGQKVTTDVTGRALFMAPSETGVLIAQISGRKIINSSTVVIAPDSTPPTSSESPSAGLRMISYPHFLSIHDQFTIEGAGFRGEADANRVFLADQLCVVLASSPVSLVVLPGLHIPIGVTGLRLSVAGHSVGPNPVVVVLLEFSGPAEAVHVGAQAKLTVHVYGTREPLDVEVHNHSPKIIQLPRGNVQRATTSGGVSNAAEIEMMFLAPGNYVVTARLIPASSELPHP